ncbi:sulfur reduction protein DsrE [Arenibacter sp. 6A1]|uniref:sulfur reduction protein DsrE n=1 Tax=Arenibacter sp. 6A1 TaxID=2720391 RepID=UPI0014473403|nr:sulfur reduction protein DsrE [Arenibacter sp. 6A1]NKI27025.1 sulfur reduction protein DsrE [Arenibacter sp. 6A1]
MKIKSLMLVACGMLFLPLLGMAQNTVQPTNYTSLVKNDGFLTAVIETTDDLIASETKNFGEIQIVFCGKKIDQLTDEAIMKPILEKIKGKPVTLMACGFSLNKFQVDRTIVPKEILVVDNGILHQFQLLKKGYLSLDL